MRKEACDRVLYDFVTDYKLFFLNHPLHKFLRLSLYRYSNRQMHTLREGKAYVDCESSELLLLTAFSDR